MTSKTRSARNDAGLIPAIRTGDHTRHVKLVNALADGANAGFHPLPPQIAQPVREVAALEEASHDAVVRLRRLEAAAAGGTDAAIAEARARAKAGEDLVDVEAAIVDTAAAIPRAELRASVISRALTAAANDLGEAVVRSGPEIFDTLELTLAQVLELAAPHARPALDGIRNWSDPAAVHRAPANAQAAFAELLELAGIHDHVRQAAVVAHELFGQKSWEREELLERIRAFEGGGVVITRAGGFLEDGRPATDVIQVVAYRPEGHPAQRLAIAAAARSREAG